MTVAAHVPTSAPHPPKLLDRLRTALLMRGTTPEVTEAWVSWVRAFIQFHQLRHPETMGEGEIGAFRTHWAIERGAPLAQQAQARLALRFLDRECLHRELGRIPVSYLPAALVAGGSAPKPLLERVREVLQVRHYA